YLAGGTAGVAPCLQQSFFPLFCFVQLLVESLWHFPFSCFEQSCFVESLLVHFPFSCLEQSWAASFLQQAFFFLSSCLNVTPGLFFNVTNVEAELAATIPVK